MWFFSSSVHDKTMMKSPRPRSSSLGVALGPLRMKAPPPIEGVAKFFRRDFPEPHVLNPPESEHQRSRELRSRPIRLGRRGHRGHPRRTPRGGRTGAKGPGMHASSMALGVMGPPFPRTLGRTLSIRGPPLISAPHLAYGHRLVIKAKLLGQLC